MKKMANSIIVQIFFLCILGCLDFLSLPRTNTSNTPDVILSTSRRLVGQKVYITCPDDYTLIGPDMVTCLMSGKWDVDAQPHCTGII